MEIIHGHLSNGKAIYGFRLQGEDLARRQRILLFELLQYQTFSIEGKTRAGYSCNKGCGFGIENPTAEEEAELFEWINKNLKLLDTLSQ